MNKLIYNYTSDYCFCQKYAILFLLKNHIIQVQISFSRLLIYAI